jgi:hypothetical protein
MNLRPLSALVLVLACDLPEVTEVGAHVELAADPGLQACSGTLAHMDEFVAAVSAEFSRAPPPPGDRVRFYWLARDDFHARSPCPDDITACARGDTSFSPLAPLDHELVHNLTAAIGTPPIFFIEGLAVAYQGLDADFPHPEFDRTAYRLADLDVRRLIEQRSGSALRDMGGYPLAGAFTAFLIRTHGIERFLRVYAALGRSATIAAIDREFQAVFGASLEQSIAEFDASARDCIEFEFNAKLVECAAPELAWDGVRLVHHRTLGCDQDDAIGPFSGDAVVVLHTLELTTAGEYQLRVIGDAEEDALAGESSRHAVSLQRCGGCGAPMLTNAAGLSARTGWLDPGRYALRLRGPASRRSSIGLRLELITTAPDATP